MDPPLPPPASPPTTKADDTTGPPKPVSPPPFDAQPTTVAVTSGEQKQATTPTDTPTPPELKAFTDALQDIKAYIDDKSKVLLEVKKLLETKSTQAAETPATTTDIGPTIDAALKPLSETLSTIDSTTAGSSRDLSNHIWESGGRHQAMEGTLSGVHGMVRDLQNRVGTTQRKLDDWVKSWSDSAGTMDDSPGVTKCLCQLREVQDELSKSSQSTEALTLRVDSVTESIGTLSSRVQSMQTLLDKMAADLPSQHLTSRQPTPLGPHPISPQEVACFATAVGRGTRQPLTGSAGAPPDHAACIYPFDRSDDPSVPRCSPGGARWSQCDQPESPPTAGHGHGLDGRPCLSDPDHNGQRDQLSTACSTVFEPLPLALLSCTPSTASCTACIPLQENVCLGASAGASRCTRSARTEIRTCYSLLQPVAKETRLAAALSD